MFRSRRTVRRSEDVGETPNTPINWRRLVGYLKPYRGRMVIAFIGTILSAALSLVFPSVIQNVVDSVFVNHDLRLLDQITMLLLLVFLLRSATSLIETFNLNYIGERITYDVRLELYKHLQDLSLGFF